jgi:hypothetical protein
MSGAAKRSNAKSNRNSVDEIQPMESSQQSLTNGLDGLNLGGQIYFFSAIFSLFVSLYAFWSGFLAMH